MLAEDFPAVHLVALAENQGATGGFHEGIKTARSRGADWVWVLDDDSIGVRATRSPTRARAAAISARPTVRSVVSIGGVSQPRSRSSSDGR